jgi:hypothetical protein
MTEIQRRNVELVRRISEVGGGDSGRSLHDQYELFFVPGFEWKPRTIGFGKKPYFGKDGFGQYVHDMEMSFEEVELTVAEIRPIADDHVLLVGRLRIVGKGSGVPVDSEWAILFRVEAGLVRSGTAFDSHAEGEEAAARA